MGKYKNLVDEMLRITEEEEVMQLFWVSGQDLYAKWEEGNITFLGDKEVIEGIKFNYGVVKEYIAKKFGVEIEKVKVLKLSNSPNMHKKIAGLFKKQEEAENKKAKEVKETKKEELEKDRIEKEETKDKFTVMPGENNFKLDEFITLFIRNKNKDYVAMYRDFKKDYTLDLKTKNEINLKDFLENIVFSGEKEVVIEKEIKIIKNLNEFSKFLLENELIFSGEEIMIAPTAEKFKLEELEERFNIKLEI